MERGTGEAGEMGGGGCEHVALSPPTLEVTGRLEAAVTGFSGVLRCPCMIRDWRQERKLEASNWRGGIYPAGELA